MPDDINCPYYVIIDPSNIMGDSNWDEQLFDWYDVECSCGKWYRIRQWDIEVIRSFEIEKTNKLKEN